MAGSSRRRALKLHDRAEELLSEIGAPSAPLTDAVMEFMAAVGDYDEGADEVITESAKSALMLSVMRGYTLRMASQEPLHFELPAEDPGGCLFSLAKVAFDDAWFFSAAFPQGSKVWQRLCGPYGRVVNAILLEDQPEGPIWPDEVIDDTVRIGYLACCVDEWFDLKPAYRNP